MKISYSKYISSIQPYAFAEVDKIVTKLKNKGVRVINFGVGDPSNPTPDFIIQELNKASKERASAGYPSYIGEMSFRQAASDYMKNNFDVQLDPESEITSTIGSKEAVFHFPFGFIDSGDIVICPSPGYPPYKNGTRFAGGIPYFVPLLEVNSFLVDFESIPTDIARKAKIIWINYPNSPTGRSATRSWYANLVSWARKYNIIIAADEGCYIDIYFNEKPVSILEIEKEGIITFYSLSKRNNMTGYRVGFCAGDERIISGFKKVKINIDSGTPTFIQDAAVVALKDDMHIEQMRTEYKQKKDILINALESIGFPKCGGDSTFYLWQKAPDGMSGVELAQKLLDVGIVVTPGEWISDVCADSINPGKNYVRFALVTSMKDLIYSTEQIKKLNF